MGGHVFTLGLDGAYTVLHTFSGVDGDNPFGTLAQDTTGILYGALSSGGPVNAGALFSLDNGLRPFVSALPNVGAAGKKVTILGQGFTGTTEVSFNGLAAS